MRPYCEEVLWVRKKGWIHDNLVAKLGRSSTKKIKGSIFECITNGPTDTTKCTAVACQC